MQTPELCDRCNSWIIADNDVAVIETWSRSYVDDIAASDMPGVAIYTSLQWLQRFNASIAIKGQTT